MDATYKEYRKQLREREREFNKLKKDYSTHMLSAMQYLVEKGVAEVVYVKYRFECGQFRDIGRWTHDGVDVVVQPDKDVPLWEMDGHTVKALVRRELFAPAEFQTGNFGKYPVKYTVNLALAKDVLVKLGYVKQDLSDAVEAVNKMNSSAPSQTRH